jgi:hypothetical protein
MRPTVLLLLILAVSPVGAAAQHIHPTLKARGVTVQRVAVLPAKLEITKRGVKGVESMIRESAALAADVQSLVGRLLAKQGFTVLEDAVGERPGAVGADGDGEPAGEGRREALADLQRRYDTLERQVQSRPKDVSKGRYSLGDEVSEFVPDGTADALVFVRGKGQVATKGKKFLTGGLVGMMADHKATMTCELAVVDARSGNVLFFARAFAAGDLVKSTKSLEKPLARSLKKLVPVT